jgi:hypothetical protein
LLAYECLLLFKRVTFLNFFISHLNIKEKKIKTIEFIKFKMHNNSRKTKTNETSLYPMSKRQRSDEVNTPPISQFQCEYCNSTFSNLPNLNQHIASFHLKNSSWTCSKCNKV